MAVNLIFTIFIGWRGRKLKFLISDVVIQFEKMAVNI
jgi:hypothetical protein